MNRSEALLVVANGHGEDVVAGRVIEALLARSPGLRVEALPIVGEGRALADAGATLVGPRRALPSGGVTLHGWRYLWADLRAGLIGLTLKQAYWLARARPRAVFVVGDFYAQLMAGLVRSPRRVLQTLVSVHHAHRGGSAGRWFMESFRAPELLLMRRADRVYARDVATAARLRELGVTRAAYLGNPMMDGLDAAPLEGAEASPAGPRVALLPGSRPYAVRSVALMIAAIERVPGALALVAWTLGPCPAPPPGWEADVVDTPGVVAAWRRGATRLWWVSDRFAGVLRSADVAQGTAGTANEQAVGVGLPLLVFPLPPDYTAEFVANQARLLGGGVTTCEPAPEKVAAALVRLWHDPAAHENARLAGAERMGPAGASAALARDLEGWLEGGA
ncbi:MAG TPA: lipid-A-disaccharide synthase-related protein [Trueperaceae bacterium]|nr:lipid-A-disaccharide synthase-related protein [Trueperaceae bacterium]